MKIIYRIPAEQYAFVEIQKDYQTDPTVEEVQETYKNLTNAFKVQVGLPTKDFNACLDRYLNDGTGETEKYLAMSPAQQAIIQELKKAFKRIESKGQPKHEGTI